MPKEICGFSFQLLLFGASRRTVNIGPGKTTLFRATINLIFAPLSTQCIKTSLLSVILFGDKAQSKQIKHFPTLISSQTPKLRNWRDFLPIFAYLLVIYYLVAFDYQLSDCAFIFRCKWRKTLPGINRFFPTFQALSLFKYSNKFHLNFNFNSEKIGDF